MKLNKDAMLAGALRVRDLLTEGSPEYRAINAHLGGYEGTGSYDNTDPAFELVGVCGALRYCRDGGCPNIGTAASVVNAILDRITQDAGEDSIEKPKTPGVDDMEEVPLEDIPREGSVDHETHRIFEKK